MICGKKTTSLSLWLPISYRYITIDPMMFHVGDIVEATIAFTCSPVREGSYQFFVALRALTLLDKSHREVGLGHIQLIL
jgi:hypothetical protein